MKRRATSAGLGAGLLFSILGAISASTACKTGGSALSGDSEERPGAGEAVVRDTSHAPEASWGPPVPSLHSEAMLDAELGRAGEVAGRPLSPALVELLDGAPGPARERALWSLARIGGPEALRRLSLELDGAELQAAAATGLLDVPVSEVGNPADPSDPRLGAGWAQLEDALWTRYAVTDPQDREVLEALAFAIARVGGSRSMARFAVEIGGSAPAGVAGGGVRGSEGAQTLERRAATAAESVGVLCARGFALDAELAGVLSDGIEADADAIAGASLYALGRCARTSGELLAESSESLGLVRRLEPFVGEVAAVAHPGLGAGAWRVLAALGQLPAALPKAVLAAEPTLPWTVEVEAVRALGASVDGRATIRARLRAAPVEAFAGPRQHVLLEALRAMRGGVASDGRATDAELTGIGDRLAKGRRSEDVRLRQLAALGACELRLLQVIRTGEPEGMRGCADQAGAPPIDAIPTSWLANLEVEALLRATTTTGAQGGSRDNLGTATVDEGAALIGTGSEAAGAEDRRRARAASLLAMAREHNPARATPALAALAEVDDPAVLPVLRAALTREDSGVLAAATTAIAVRSIDSSKRDLEVVALLEDLIRQRRDAGALEARLAAIEALGTLARSALSVVTPEGVPGVEVGDSPWLGRTVVPLGSDPILAVRRVAREALLGHEELLRAFDELEARGASGASGAVFGKHLEADLDSFASEGAVGLRVTTSAGSFTIDFRTFEAPINQSNLAALASAGFYDGLSFHRVVAGFVVQGGDPRGDGYGGPGYLVPCERSNHRYRRGTVGMALAGKDTGGSQFFITHAPQPHLDGRYTAIGQVRDEADMAVVDALLPGDRIISVEVLR